MSISTDSSTSSSRKSSDSHGQYLSNGPRQSPELTSLNFPAVERGREVASDASPINQNDSLGSRRSTMEEYQQSGSSADGRIVGQAGRNMGDELAGGQTTLSGTEQIQQVGGGYDHLNGDSGDIHGGNGGGILRRRPEPLNLGNNSNVYGENAVSRGHGVGPGSNGENGAQLHTSRPTSYMGLSHDAVPAIQSPIPALTSVPLASSNIGSASSPYAYSYAMRQQQQRAQLQVLSHGSTRRDEHGHGQGQEHAQGFLMQRSGSGQSAGISPLGDVRPGPTYFGQISPGITSDQKDPTMRDGGGSAGGQATTYPSTSDAQNGQRISPAIGYKSNGYPPTSHDVTPYSGAPLSYPVLPPLPPPGQAYAPMPYASQSANASSYGTHSYQPQGYPQLSHQSSYSGYGTITPSAANGVGPDGVLSRHSSGYGMSSGAEEEDGLRMEGGYGMMTAAVDRPFRCDECTQSFSRNHDLKRHKRIHLTVKPFACDKCGKQFSRKDALRRHWLVKGCKSENSTGINPEFRANLPSLSPSSPPELSQSVASSTSYFPGYNPTYTSHPGSYQNFQYPAARPQPLVRNFSSDTNGSTILTPQEATFPTHSPTYPQQRPQQFAQRPSTIGPLETGSSGFRAYYTGSFAGDGNQASASFGSGSLPTTGSAGTVPPYRPASGLGGYASSGQYGGPPAFHHSVSDPLRGPQTFGVLNSDNRTLSDGSLSTYPGDKSSSLTNGPPVLIVQPGGLMPAKALGTDRNAAAPMQRSSSDYELSTGEVGQEGGTMYLATNSYNSFPSFQKPSTSPYAGMGRTTSLNSMAPPSLYSPGIPSPSTPVSGTPRSPYTSSFQAPQYGQPMSRQSSLNPAQRQMSQQGLVETNVQEGQAGQTPRWHRSSFPFPAPSHQHHPSVGSEYQGGSEVVERSAHQTSHSQRSPLDEQGGRSQSQQQQEQFQAQNQNNAAGVRHWSRASFPFPAAATSGPAVTSATTGTGSGVEQQMSQPLDVMA